MFKYFNATIKSADIFGQPIRLQINGDENINSILGGFMTIILVILIGVTFAIYSKDSFFKLNPQILSSTKYISTNGMISLNQTYFRFIINTSSKLDTTPYLTINSNGYEFSDCISDISQTSPSYNGSILTNNWYCINFTNSTKMIEDFILTINYCTNNSYCKSREEINNFLGTQTVGLLYLIDSAILNPNNFSFPIETNINWYLSVIRPNTVVLNSVISTIHKLITDDGLIYSNEYSNDFKINSLFGIFDDNQQEKTWSNSCVDNPTSCNELFVLNLNSYKKIITYQRTYKRISDALANVGGLSSILMTVFTVFMNLYCTFIRNEKIANRVYDFNFKHNDQFTNIKKNIRFNINNIQNNNDHDNKNSNLQISDCVNNQITNKSKNFQSGNFNNRNLERNEEKLNDPNVVEKIITELPFPRVTPSNTMNQAPKEIKLIPLDKINEHRNQKKYKFKFYHLIAYYVCCHYNKKSELKNQYETYKKVQIEMKSLLDIKRIVSLTEELDTLKMIILNNEQYALLKFITKYDLVESPESTNNKIENKFNLDKNLLKNEDYLINVVNGLIQKLKEDKISIQDPITSKLINYIDINFLDNKVDLQKYLSNKDKIKDAKKVNINADNKITTNSEPKKVEEKISKDITTKNVINKIEASQSDFSLTSREDVEYNEYYEDHKYKRYFENFNRRQKNHDFQNVDQINGNKLK